jgi:hypothetical protein
MKWSYTTPNVALRAEWNIESVILQYLQELSLSFTFLHFKSHQDDNGPVASLTLESRLNVEADRLATEFLQADEPRQPIALLFPSAKCQLIVNNKSVTQRIPQALRYKAGSTEIRKYLMHQNTWTEQTLDDVNWDAHGAGHSYHRPHRCYPLYSAGMRARVGDESHPSVALLDCHVRACNQELNRSYLASTSPSKRH